MKVVVNSQEERVFLELVSVKVLSCFKLGTLLPDDGYFVGLQGRDVLTYEVALLLQGLPLFRQLLVNKTCYNLACSSYFVLMALR